ncbi:MAG TPA: PPOX class F420-dependent oxidoreductase [Gaiellaceae bacterium]|jgi:PPOX class probable F420-dependent enzyme|nr:PPOX class F420-dependent oxidoreductase [Gaiellaceae bacterium]
MELTDAQRQFLENPFVGVVTTLQPDGMPQSTVVWVDVDEEGVSVNTAYGRVKPRNLERDPRLSLVVVDPNDPYRWFKLSGTGTLVDDGADEQIDRLSKKYTGRDVYASRQPGERRVTVRITPTRTLSRGLD